ncbi:hypothetical protein NDR87_14485 [Nocardia sp. CDC159]|uniref:Uncharacterized protein n=1 Tax=Nocardia pulmonis TaxID=2951408 RepID=A0A9X2IYY1_9NOCA|nr:MULTISPECIES: hypothetical protein [Nocardia]MCM6774371.1 hypothetical protein [Nocardia pulmonis]MCM6787563.1 hypothetical protein [Nocardia sp. CDC159]
MSLFTVRRVVAAGLVGGAATAVLALPAVASAQAPLSSGSGSSGPAISGPVIVAPVAPGSPAPDGSGTVIVTPDGQRVIGVPAQPLAPGATVGAPGQCHTVTGQDARFYLERDGDPRPDRTLVICSRP